MFVKIFSPQKLFDSKTPIQNNQTRHFSRASNSSNDIMMLTQMKFDENKSNRTDMHHHTHVELFN